MIKFLCVKPCKELTAMSRMHNEKKYLQSASSFVSDRDCLAEVDN